MGSDVLLFFFHHFIAKYFIKGAKYHYKFTTFLPGIAAVLVTCGVFYLFYDFWYIRWGIGAVLGVYLLVRVYKQKSIF